MGYREEHLKQFNRIFIRVYNYHNPPKTACEKWTNWRVSRIMECWFVTFTYCTLVKGLYSRNQCMSFNILIRDSFHSMHCKTCFVFTIEFFFCCWLLSPILKGKIKSFQHFLWTALTTCFISLMSISAGWGKYPNGSEWKLRRVRIILQTPSLYKFCLQNWIFYWNCKWVTHICIMLLMSF